LTLHSKLLVIILIASALYFFKAYYVQEQNNPTAEKEMGTALNLEVNHIDNWVLKKANMVTRTAKLINDIPDNNDISIQLLAPYQTDSDLVDLYVGLEDDGRIVDGSQWQPPAGYDVRTRSWYQETKQKNAQYISAACFVVYNKVFNFTIAMPLHTSTGAFRGVVSEDIDLTSILNEVKAIRVHNHGYAILLDQNFVSIVGPDNTDSYNFDDNIDFINKTYNVSKKDRGTLRYELHGEKKIMVFEKIPSSGWTLALIADE